MAAIRFIVPLVLFLTTAAGAQSSSNLADQLHDKAQFDDAAGVKSLLANGADPNAFNQYGEPPIIIAALMGNEDIVRILVAAGARVDQRDKSGDTAMLRVILSGARPDMVETLLSLGANIEGTNAYTKTTPLLQAAHGTSPNHTAIVKLLLAHHAQVDAANGIGETALILALQQGNEASARLLLSAGANVRLGDRRGTTPLIAAAPNGSAEIIKTLLAAGAARDARMDDGRTALSWSTFNGNIPALQVLLAAGSDPNIRAKDGLTPLRDAVVGGGGHPQAVVLLLKAGAAINARADDGATALFSAMPYANVEIVRTLLSNGADPNLADQYGRTPLKMAILNHHDEIANLLRAAGGRE